MPIKRAKQRRAKPRSGPRTLKPGAKINEVHFDGTKDITINAGNNVILGNSQKSSDQPFLGVVKMETGTVTGDLTVDGKLNLAHKTLVMRDKNGNAATDSELRLSQDANDENWQFGVYELDSQSSHPSHKILLQGVADTAKAAEPGSALETALTSKQDAATAFDGDYANLTNKPATFAPVIGTGAADAMAGDTTTITAQQATDILANKAKTSFPGFGTGAGKALEGTTTTITAQQATDISDNKADITTNSNKISHVFVRTGLSPDGDSTKDTVLQTGEKSDLAKAINELYSDVNDANDNLTSLMSGATTASELKATKGCFGELKVEKITYHHKNIEVNDGDLDITGDLHVSGDFVAVDISAVSLDLTGDLNVLSGEINAKDIETDVARVNNDLLVLGDISGATFRGLRAFDVSGNPAGNPVIDPNPMNHVNIGGPAVQANDTFNGYSMFEVVNCLRNFGFLR